MMQDNFRNSLACVDAWAAAFFKEALEPLKSKVEAGPSTLKILKA